MYNPNVEYQMPSDIEQLTQSFFAMFCSSFSEEEAASNAITLRKLESDLNTPFYLIEMIKEFLVDENKIYGKYLSVITSYFIKLIEKNRDFRNHCINFSEYKSQIISSILYILPFLAKLFQETNEIIYFNHLYLVLISLINEQDNDVIELFNNYIDQLLSDDSPHKIIISMLFASKVKLSNQNHEKFTVLIKNLLTQLPESNLDDEIEILAYKIIFTEMRSFLTTSMIFNTIEVPFVLQAICNFNLNFIQQYYDNQDTIIPTNKIDLIENILIYCINLEHEYPKVMGVEDNPLKKFIENLTNFFYYHGSHLIISSRYLLSNKIGKLILQYTRYLIIQASEQSFARFARFIYSLAVLTQEDMEGVESQESFFYDFYDINFENADQFSNRQILSLFLNNITKKTNNPQFCLIILTFLCNIKVEEINETHFYLLSLINLISFYNFTDNQELLESLFKLTCQYYEIGSEILATILAQSALDSLENVIFMFTFYFFLDTSLFLINEEQVTTINEEVSRLMDIIQTCAEGSPEENFNGILFTFFCILIDSLSEKDGLLIPIESINQFLGQFNELCFTNHAIKFMEKLVDEKDQNKIFFGYFDKCEQMISNFKGTVQNRKDMDDNEEEEDDFIDCSIYGIPDRELDYTIRFFYDNIKKMSDIIRRIDFTNFDDEDLERIKDLSIFLLSKGEDWKFIDECIEFMSAILSKTPDLFNWSQFYIEKIDQYERPNFFGEWVVPLIHGISYQPELMSQELFDIISTALSENINTSIDTLNGGIQRKILATWDALMSITLLTRLFEFGVRSSQLDLQIPDETVKGFIELIDEIQPTEEDVNRCNNYCTDYYIKDQELGSNIMKLASLLAAPLMSVDEICQFLKYLVEEGQIVSDEMRYIIIILIDNLIKPDPENNFSELRQCCLTNTIQASDEFKQIYNSDQQYFVRRAPHPIFELYQIDGFVFDTEEIREEEEEEEGKGGEG